MAIVNFENLPSENTPLTGGGSGNLNVMQENGTSHGTDTKLGYSQAFLNEHILNVSNEVDEDYRVNFIKSKNLFDGYLVNGYNPTDASTNTGRLRTNYIKVKPNTTYVCSLIPPTGKTGQFYVYEYTDKGQTPTGTNWKNSGVSFQTGNTTQYISLCLKCTDDSVITSTSFSNIQLEEGNTATTYEPYITPSINVDGEDTFYSNTYSTGEVVIGKWLGKPLYRKVIDCGALPNNTYKNTNHNISNIDYITKYYAIVSNGTQFWFIPFTSVSGLTGQVAMYVDKTKVVLTTGADRSAYSGYAILEYTKTTD